MTTNPEEEGESDSRVATMNYFKCPVLTNKKFKGIKKTRYDPQAKKQSELPLGSTFHLLNKNFKSATLNIFKEIK